MGGREGKLRREERGKRGKRGRKGGGCIMAVVRGWTPLVLCEFYCYFLLYAFVSSLLLTVPPSVLLHQMPL